MAEVANLSNLGSEVRLTVPTHFAYSNSACARTVFTASTCIVKAPTGQNRPALGNAPGSTDENKTSPERAKPEQVEFWE